MEATSASCPLLSEKGVRIGQGWSTEAVFDYNKERVRPGTDIKEWESYRLFNSRFAVELLYGHAAAVGCARVVLHDFETGERFSFGGCQLFPGDGFSLDFGSDTQHFIKCEEKGLFLMLDHDGERRKLKARADHFELSLTAPEIGEALSFVTPFPAKRQFFYGYHRVFPDFSGVIRLNNLSYPMDGDTVLSVSGGRGVFPKSWEYLHIVGGCMTGEGYLALDLSENTGAGETDSECVAALDGRVYALGALHARYSEENDLQPWTVSDSEGRVRLYFTPQTDASDGIGALLWKKSTRMLWGTAEGTVTLDDGQPIRVEHLPLCCSLTQCRW